MPFDGVHSEGYDHLGPGRQAFTDGSEWTGLIGNGAWTSIDSVAHSALSRADSLVGPGYSMLCGTGGNSWAFRKSLGAAYGKFTGHICYRKKLVPGAAASGLIFFSGSTIMAQFLLASDGIWRAYRGGTEVYVATNVIADLTTNHVEWEYKPNTIGGTLKLYVNGVEFINFTGNTSNNGGATCNNYVWQVGALGSSGAPYEYHDHFFMKYSTDPASADAMYLTNPRIETTFPDGDDVVDFTQVTGVLGDINDGDYLSRIAGAANIMYFRRYTPDVNCTLNSISFRPYTSSVGGKMKGFVYSDSAGLPHTLLSGGTEVVGVTASSEPALPLTTPQALTGGTPYWIGFMSDTAIDMAQNGDGLTLGYRVARTYASGPVTPDPAVTGNFTSYTIWGNCSLFAENWAVHRHHPTADDRGYTESPTVGDKEYVFFSPLVEAPEVIHFENTKARVRKTDSGPRLVDIMCKSAATEANGTYTNIGPSTSMATEASARELDPNGNIAWTAAALEAASGGVKIVA